MYSIRESYHIKPCQGDGCGTMSVSYNTPPRDFTWHGLRFTAPRGPRGILTCITPRELWALFQKANTPVNPLVLSEIKSCLTQVYLGYLEEARSLHLMGSKEYATRKDAWKHSDQWSFLEGIAANNSRGRQDYYEGGGKTLNMQNKACLPSVLTNGKSYALGYSKTQQVTADPSVSGIAGAYEMPQRPLFQEPTAPAAFTDNQSLSSTHSSASVMASSSLTPKASGHEAAARSVIRSVSLDTGSKRRFSISYDADDEHDQNTDKKPKLEGYHGMNFELLGDNVIISSRNFSSLASTMSQDLASTMGGLASCRSKTNVSTNKANGSPEKILALRQSMVSPGKSKDASQRFSAVGSLTDLTMEDGASLWLNYNLGTVLEHYPPNMPAHTNTLDAVQQTFPYLLSLKTRLVSLLSTAEDIRDSHLGKWIREEIGRAIRDTGTAWDCLRIVPAQQNVLYQDMEDKEMGGQNARIRDKQSCAGLADTNDRP